MTSDERQRQLFHFWIKLDPDKLQEWIAQQPDRQSLLDLLEELEQALRKEKLEPKHSQTDSCFAKGDRSEMQNL